MILCSLGALSWIFIIQHVSGYSSGAPPIVCRNNAMDPTPGHGPGPSTNPPYRMLIDSQTYSPGQLINRE